MQKNRQEETKINFDSEASVISSNIKIFRNIEDYPFAGALSSEKKSEMEGRIIDFLEDNECDINVFETGELEDYKVKEFLDRNLLSEDFIEQKDRKFIVCNKYNVSLFLNYNEHITINAESPMLQIEEDFSKLENLEIKIGEEFGYLASSKYGFLTSQLKNCGLGVTISAFVYLPGLFYSKEIEKTQELFLDRGFLISEWLYNKKPREHYFTVTSNLNFGLSEEDLVKRFILGINNLIEMDQKALFYYYLKNKDEIVDNIHRSYGILRHAVQIDYEEALDHISNLRMGILVGEELQVSITTLNNLFLQIKDGVVNDYARKNNVNTNIARANIIKELIS